VTSSRPHLRQSRSGAAGYSLFHFIRVFNAVTRHSPFDYLMRRRVSESAVFLHTYPDVRIIDVAVEYGFGSHEAFTRAFRRMFGLTPSSFRSEPPGRCLIGDTGPPLFTPMAPEYLEFLATTKIVPAWEELRQLKLFGVMDQAPYPPMPPKPSDTSCSFDRPSPAESCSLDTMRCRVLRFSDKIRQFDGYPVDSVEEPSVEGCYMILPGGRHLRFTVAGTSTHLTHLYRYVLLTWLPLDGQIGRTEYAVERYESEGYSLLVPYFTGSDGAVS
jgi:AraC family transcriptional regulator